LNLSVLEWADVLERDVFFWDWCQILFINHFAVQEAFKKIAITIYPSNEIMRS